MYFVLASVFVLVTVACASRYTFPEPTFEIVDSHGMDVSIPDDRSGIELFAIVILGIDHDFPQPIRNHAYSPKDGRWSIEIGSKGKPVDIKMDQEVYYKLVIREKSGRQHESERDTFKVNADKISTRPLQAQVTTDNTSRWDSTQADGCEESSTIFSGKGVVDFIYYDDPSTLQKDCSGKLIFEEYFNNFDQWQKEIKFAGAPLFEFVTYTDDERILYVDKKGLHINPTAVEDLYGPGFLRRPAGWDLGSNCTGTMELDCKRIPFAYNILPPVVSGRITTKNFSFKYGRIEIRAKLIQGMWIYPEITLTPKLLPDDTGYGVNTIWIAYALGNSGTQLWGGYYSNGTIPHLTEKLPKNPWYKEFHVYSIIWTEDEITLMVDNETYGTAYPFAGGFDKEMSIRIGVAVGGHLFDDVTYKPYTNNDAKEMLNFYNAQDDWRYKWDGRKKLIVDYIKVYSV